MKSPVSILENFIGKICLFNKWTRKPGKPGALVESLSDEDKKILKSLSSDDLRGDSRNIDYWKNCAGSNTDSFKKDKLDFDRKIFANTNKGLL